LHDIFFYIFAALSILSVLLISFSAEVKNTIVYFVYFTASACGLLIISNDQLFSLLLTLAILITFSAAYLYKEKLAEYFNQTEFSNRVNIFSVLAVSLLTAILASLLGNTRWKMFIADADVNSYSLIFTKYFPIILVSALLLSVIIPAFTRIIKINVKES